MTVSLMFYLSEETTHTFSVNYYTSSVVVVIVIHFFKCGCEMFRSVNTSSIKEQMALCESFKDVYQQIKSHGRPFVAITDTGNDSNIHIHHGYKYYSIYPRILSYLEASLTTQFCTQKNVKLFTDHFPSIFQIA